LDTDNTPFLPVGSKPAGAGTLGHLDLSGSMWEWVFDSLSMIVYQTFATKTCIDCFFTGEGGLYGGTTPTNALRGGGWSLPTAYLRSAHRGGHGRFDPLPVTGMRCARPAVP
jgi:formylglycine-generating enzyme required for sulfatase activity